MRSRNSLHSFQHEPGGPATHPIPVRAALRSRRAFTLVEVMGATCIFCLAILGVYAVLIRSYEMVTFARYRDNARAVLTSLADQFGRQQTSDNVIDTTTGATITLIRPIFQVNVSDPFTPTGFGLSWTDTANPTVPILGGPHSDGDYLSVTLGDSSTSPVIGKVTREVLYVNTADGTVQTVQPNTAGGWILQGIFTIKYRVNSRDQQEQLTVARSVP